MAKQVTFIHASDLHIGAPFKGLHALSPRWAKRLLSAISESYQKLIDAALASQVDFVVIAGDIFDSSRASYADYLTFFDGLKRLEEAGIAVYLCAGNHDPSSTWKQEYLSLPSNVVMFPADKPGYKVFKKDGEALVLLCGRSFLNHAWPRDKDISEGLTRKDAERVLGCTAPFGVGVLHTGLNLDKDMAQTDPNTLLGAGMDYWALGHIHQRYHYPENNPRLVYPGCIQGRRIHETGERGVYKVTLSKHGYPHMEFIPTATVVWQQIEVSVSDCLSIGEINERIMRELLHENGKAHCEEMCVRIYLTGKTKLHKLLNSPGVLEDMRVSINDSYPVFYCDALINKTVQPFDVEILKEEGLFPAVFMQVSAGFREDANDEIAYLQDEFLKKNLSLPRSCEKDIEDIAKDAETLMLDLLIGSDK